MSHLSSRKAIPIEVVERIAALIQSKSQSISEHIIEEHDIEFLKVRGILPGDTIGLRHKTAFEIGQVKQITVDELTINLNGDDEHVIDRKEYEMYLIHTLRRARQIELLYDIWSPSDKWDWVFIHKSLIDIIS